MSCLFYVYLVLFTLCLLNNVQGSAVELQASSLQRPLSKPLLIRQQHTYNLLAADSSPQEYKRSPFELVLYIIKFIFKNSFFIILYAVKFMFCYVWKALLVILIYCCRAKDSPKTLISAPPVLAHWRNFITFPNLTCLLGVISFSFLFPYSMMKEVDDVSRPSYLIIDHVTFLHFISNSLSTAFTLIYLILAYICDCFL